MKLETKSKPDACYTLIGYYESTGRVVTHSIDGKSIYDAIRGMGVADADDFQVVEAVNRAGEPQLVTDTVCSLANLQEGYTS